MKDTVEIRIQDLLDLIHWARRYCDYRRTYVPSDFNRIYDRIKERYPDLKDEMDETLMENGKFWPYAQDGQYNEKTGNFDARPRKNENQ